MPSFHAVESSCRLILKGPGACEAFGPFFCAPLAGGSHYGTPAQCASFLRLAHCSRDPRMYDGLALTDQ